MTSPAKTIYFVKRKLIKGLQKEFGTYQADVAISIKRITKKLNLSAKSDFKIEALMDSADINNRFESTSLSFMNAIKLSISKINR